MSYDIVKFERGQVWMVRFRHPESVGHEQDKDRPYLILSVGRFNKSSGMITAVPITTRDRIYTPSQVMFINERCKNNVILCEQIRSFDYQSGNYIFDFMGMISDEILEKVDVALSIHLGLHYSPITLKSLYDSMEAIIKSVGYMQQKVNTPKFTDEDVRQFAEKLQSLATPLNINTDYGDVIADMDVAYSIPPVEEVAAAEEVEEPKSSSNTKNKRIKWTTEKCWEFMNDVNTISIDQIMKKWDIKTKHRFYSMKHYVGSLLEDKE